MYKVLADCRGMDNGEILEEIMSVRRVDMDFFEPTEDDFYDNLEMENMSAAADKIQKAIENNTEILIYYDTDADGVSSGTIMYNYLTDCGATNLQVYINEGKQHGLSGFDFSLIEHNTENKLMIVVDSLDKNLENYQKAIEHHYDIVIFDHHKIIQQESELQYDDILTLVSSQRDSYHNKALCGAGVVFKFCKYYDQIHNSDYADKYWDLATVGTIADMMDMRVPENRYICKRGFENLTNPMIKKLIGSYDFNGTAVSFSIAPRINACNRIKKNLMVVEAFKTNNVNKCKYFVDQMDEIKKEQGVYADKIFAEAIMQCENQKDASVLVCVFENTYNVAGLVGNKLISKYKKPVLVLSENETTYFGSARGFGIEDFSMLCDMTGLCATAGHELAFGIEISKDNFDSFIKKIREFVLAERGELPDDTIIVDIRLNADDITSSLVDMIEVIDKITGENFKPINVAITITDYEVSNMSKGKHLVLKTPNINFVKWNFKGNFEEFEDYAMMCQPITLIGHLSNGYIGRTFMNKLVIDEMVIENG